ncbi:adhesion G protein-coupled receptor E5 [Orycteropus afer afer]|uniref:Adhesion G protein-coupled receptor E5 n=1 Tax=Orycteropus afer afer TaxID=1230840 RepID=A0AC54ZEV8_ORYAF|nr:adhesion G protein-coupled receptor E5 [Orycteropus afer afer]
MGGPRRVVFLGENSGPHREGRGTRSTEEEREAAWRLRGHGGSHMRRRTAANCARWCPENSTCISATACRCDPGFSSPSGDITSPAEACDDINECAPPVRVSCGKFADCQNVEGSYYCTCSPGYMLPTGGKAFRNESENMCQDVDECQQNQKLCKSRGTCINTHGSYTCQCPLGFEFKPDDVKVCADVNECSSGQNPCHNTTHCLNNVGGYECRCRQGWKPMPGSPNGPKMSFPSWSRPSGVTSQSLSRFFDKVQELSRDFKPNSARKTIQNLITFVDELLEEPGDLEVLDLPARHRVATQLLLGLEQVLRTLAQALPEASFTYHSPANTELSLKIQENRDGDKHVIVGQSHARMQLNWATAAPDKDSGPTVVGILSSLKMQRLLANASLDLEPWKKAELEETHESPVQGAQLSVLSAVNSAFLSNTNTEKLDSPITFAFSHKVSPQLETPGPRQELICAFWRGDSHKGGQWATTGCQMLGSGNGSTTCQCSHLSSFAVLMAHYKVEDPKLALITKVGLSLSLICLMLCILTFLLVRPIQSSRTTVHLHLCICLFVGSAIFLAGIENEGGQVGLRCRLVAGLLHYFFLAAFCWMSLEGLELYFLVVRVFQGQGLSTRWLCLIGYGVPGVIVGVSAAVNSQGYGRVPYCWLDPAGGFLWSFLGPVTFIVLCNAVVFVITVWKLTQKFSEINPDMKKLKKARVLTITAVAQLFVLGCTWVFGLFLFDPHSWVLSYIFTILNCLQGLFLFLLHCLLNKKVREEYWKWLCLVTRNKYSEFTSSTSATSHNQTRALRQSESGM